MKILVFLSVCLFLGTCEVAEVTPHYEEKSILPTDYSSLFFYSGCIQSTVNADNEKIVRTFDENGRELSLIKLPCDSIPHRIVLLNTTYCSYVKKLNAAEQIKGIAAFESLKSDTFFLNKGIENVGEQGVLNIEKIQSLNPDLIICSSFQEKDLAMLTCPILVVNEFWERNPLARAEWIKAFAVVLGKEELGGLVFDDVQKKYHATINVSIQPKSVFNVQLYSAQYFVPGCDALLNRFLSDAGFSVLCEEGSGTKSSELSQEKVIEAALETDYLLFFDWSNKNKTYTEVLEHLKLQSFFSGKVIYCNTMLNDYFEASVMSPEVILEELSRVNRGQDTRANYFSVLEQ